MHFLGNNWVCWGLECVGLLIQIANCFLSNIAVYEASTGFSFDCEALLKNGCFWATLVCQLVYFILSKIISFQNKKTDETVEKALNDGSVSLVTQAVNYSEQGDFVSAKEALKLFSMLQSKRR